MDRHPLDVVSLLAGIATLAGVALYLLDIGGSISLSAHWFAPAVLIAVGLSRIATAGNATHADGKKSR